jgi:hypothetical protein
MTPRSTAPGNQHAAKHSAAGLWALLDRLGPAYAPWLLRGNKDWNLFVRLADPDQHREAVTSRPLLLEAIGRQINHAGRTTVTISSAHGQRDRVRRALTRIAAFFAELRETAEQLTYLDPWYRILSRALVKYLKGGQLDPPRRL